MSKYTLIVKYLKAFEAELDENQEMCIKFPDYETSFLLQSTITGGDDFIAFELLSDKGEKISVIQSYSQLNFAITSRSKPIADKPARRVGFIAKTDDFEL